MEKDKHTGREIPEIDAYVSGIFNGNGREDNGDFKIDFIL